MACLLFSSDKKWRHGVRLRLIPIYTAKNFWHGSDKDGTRTKKIGSARINFTVQMNLPLPNFIRAEPNFTRARTVRKGSLSTDIIGAGTKKTSAARIKCAV